MGQLVFQATLGGQVNLVGPNTASTFNLNVPAVSSTLATLTGTETFTNKTLTSPTLTTPVLGTPASGTLTNCTSLPVGGITATGTPSSTTYLRGDSTWATITATTPGGSTTQVQYNSSGSFAGSANMTFSGTALTLANDASISGLTVGKGGGAVSTNTAVGYQAGFSNTTGSTLTAIGYQASYSATTNASDTSLGWQAGYTKNTASDTLGSTFVGSRAGYATSTGIDNSFIGGFAGRNNTTGSNNAGVGTGALFSNTTASNNTAVGYQAGYTGTTASESVYLGNQAGYSVATSTQNTLLGSVSGYSTTGAQNTFLGQQSGYYVTSGAKNTIIGRYSGNQGGLDIRTLSNYTVLSDGDGNPRVIVDSNGYMGIGTIPVTSISNTTGITLAGPLGYTQQTRNSVLGAFNRTASDGSIFVFYREGSGVGSISVNGTNTQYNTSSDYRLKENIVPMTGALSKVAQLKPVTYIWKKDQSDGEGFIAHELAEVCPHAVTGEKDAVDADGNPEYQGIDVSFLVATLTAALQELNAKFDAYVASHP